MDSSCFEEENLKKTIKVVKLEFKFEEVIELEMKHHQEELEKKITEDQKKEKNKVKIGKRQKGNIVNEQEESENKVIVAIKEKLACIQI